LKDSGSGIEYVKQHNFMYIFAGVLVVLLIAPVMAELKEGNRHILQAGLDLSLLLGIWSVVDHRRWFIFGVILLFCGVSITITDAFLNLPELRLATFVVVLPFYLLTAVLALRHVLYAKTVDSNILAGSICVYLLMGVIWAIVYSFVDYISPDSFSGMVSEAQEDRFLGFLYYSFVTLTTLGYGDILPVKPIARACGYLEAVIGQIYLVVLIAGLVGLHIADREKDY
jgi:voltage-gated potassium channel